MQQEAQITSEFPSLLYPNLNFEEELAGATHQSAIVRSVLRDIGPLMTYAARAGDKLLGDEHVVLPEPVNGIPVSSDPSPENCHLEPWGWSHSARQIAREIGMPEALIPSDESVRLVNDRRFLVRHDRVMGPDGVLSDTTVGVHCSALDQVQRAIENLISPGSRWVIKPQFSQAARNRLVGQRAALTSQQKNWLRGAISHGVTIEPWLDRQNQAGLQFEISRGGAVRFLGVAQMLTTAGGQYLGSVLHPESEVRWMAAVEHGRIVCESIRDAGYWGPVGIDAFQFTDTRGASCIRLCHDINARWTMGKLALCMERFRGSREIAVWLHVSPDEAAQISSHGENAVRNDAVADVRILMTGCRSPGLQFASVLLIGETKHRIQRFLNSAGCTVEIPD